MVHFENHRKTLVVVSKTCDTSVCVAQPRVGTELVHDVAPGYSRLASNVLMRCLLPLPLSSTHPNPSNTSTGLVLLHFILSDGLAARTSSSPPSLSPLHAVCGRTSASTGRLASTSPLTPSTLVTRLHPPAAGPLHLLTRQKNWRRRV